MATGACPATLAIDAEDDEPIVLGLLLLRTERIAWGDKMAAARQVRELGAS